MKIIKVKPGDPIQKDVDMIRINGAFCVKFDEVRGLRAQYPKIPIIFDIPKNRKKPKPTPYTDEELIEFANKEKFDYIAISYVEKPEDLETNFKGKICAKIENVNILPHLKEIVDKADMVMIDKEDLELYAGVNADYITDLTVDMCFAKSKQCIIAKDDKLKLASVAVFPGRFQPFHNEHLDRVKQLSKNHEKVCIVMFKTKQNERNPYTVEQRKRMIDAALKEEGIKNYYYSIWDVPDENAVVYTENPMLVKFFENIGQEVKINPERTISATNIRYKKHGWETMLPKAVKKVVEEIEKEEQNF